MSRKYAVGNTRTLIERWKIMHWDGRVKSNVIVRSIEKSQLRRRHARMRRYVCKFVNPVLGEKYIYERHARTLARFTAVLRNNNVPGPPPTITGLTNSQIKQDANRSNRRSQPGARAITGTGSLAYTAARTGYAAAKAPQREFMN